MAKHMVDLGLMEEAGASELQIKINNFKAGVNG